MTDLIYPIKPNFRDAAITPQIYEEMYRQSIEEPEKFWEKEANKFIDFDKKWDSINSEDFSKGEISWFAGAKLNISYNCIDRHLKDKADEIALIWQGDDPLKSKKITYQELYHSVCRFANLLKSQGVKKGDRVCIYMPMILEAVYAMLACSRIGAIHSVVFGGFSSDSLRARVSGCESICVITANEGLRGGKAIPLKANVTKAVKGLDHVKSVIVVDYTDSEVHLLDKEVLYSEEIVKMDDTCDYELMDAEDPLFILYTSGSTGAPKGVLHTTAGYLLYTAMTFKYVFDYKPKDVYWCTADIGWITGHSYLVYAPLANGATSLVFEGIPTYPDAGRFWQVIEKHKVNLFYTAPTAIRSLMGLGNSFVEKYDLSSLRVLGTVGEPINPEAWRWYYETIGKENCPIVDTWWQTETGGHMITPMPGATNLKPGSASKPFFGVEIKILDDTGNVLEGECSGNLVIARSWPSMIRGVYGDKKRFMETYLSVYPGYYFAGDGVHRDKDGYYWITGRVDDVLNVSGHRLSTAEIESALVHHKDVTEAAIVGYPHDIKGQGIYAYVTLNADVEVTDALKKDIIAHVRGQIGPIATIDLLQWAPSLPKTRSGKIMRRILRKIAANELDTFGDTSTLAEPTVLDELIRNRLNR